MKNNKNKNDIELVVFNYFIRVIKSDGKYMIFRRSVNNTGIMKFLIKKSGNYYDNPFSSLSSTGEIVKELERITNDMAKSNGVKGGIKNLDRYERVTMTINHLLHFFMESNGVSMDKLCSLGEEIYNLSCHRLFGDTLEELEKQNEEELASINNIEQLKSKLFQEFIKGISSGKISKNVSFDEFVKQHSDELNKLKSVKVSTENCGQILGKAPEDNAFIEAINSYDDGRPAWLADWDYVDDRTH